MRSTKSRVLTAVVLLTFGFVQLFGSGIAPAAYQLVMQAGAGLARRTTVNFIGAGVTCVDNPGSARTDCSIPGSSYLFSSTASATNAAAAEATVIGAGSGSLTLPADYFGTAGSPLIVSASGYYSTPAVPGTLRIRLRIGAATVVDTGAVAPTALMADQVWTLEVRVVSRTVGAGGTVMAQAQFRPGIGSSLAGDLPMLNTAVVALNTTLANAVDLTAEWSAAGGETITGTNFLMYGVTGASVSTPAGYATIQQATVPLAQRLVVNFTGAGVTCVDNAGTGVTDCTITGGGAADPSTFNLTGTYAALPAAGTAGRVYYPTDSAYTHLRDNGATWDHFLDGRKLTPPVLGDFAWVNQGAATAVATYGGIYLDAVAGAGDNCRILKKAAPATPYTVTAAFMVDAYRPPNTPRQGGILFRGAGTGKLHTINHRWESGLWHISSVKFTNPTTFSAIYVDADLYTHPHIVWVQITDDGANRVTRYSDNGMAWFEVSTVGRADFLTADEIGFYANSVDAVNGTRMWLIHWVVT